MCGVDGIGWVLTCHRSDGTPSEVETTSRTWAKRYAVSGLRSKIDAWLTFRGFRRVPTSGDG